MPLWLTMILAARIGPEWRDLCTKRCEIHVRNRAFIFGNSGTAGPEIYHAQ